jgi:FkbM family methyltransferase
MNALLETILGRMKGRSVSLPYNLNWGIKTEPLSDFLSKSRIFVIDVGARNGPPSELAGLSKFLCYVGFDADQQECQRLMSVPHEDCASYRISPYFIGRGGTIDFLLYSDRGTSSNYRIDGQYSEAFLEPPPQLERAIALNATPLDDVVDREHLDSPDFLKLDTQGSELDILRGASRTLAQTSLVEVEVEFYPMYDGQPLFAEVDSFLRSAGFELLYLNRVFGQRRNIYKGLSRGQLLFGDALYGRSPSQLGGFSPERKAKYTILLCHYGHVDLAYQIYQEQDEVQAICPAISGCFSMPPGPIRRKLMLLLDRLMLLPLHLRRTNHMFQDSDRSWPVR